MGESGAVELPVIEGLFHAYCDWKSFVIVRFRWLEVEWFGDDWDKIGWVFVPATVGEVVGCRVWGLDRAGIFLIIIVDYAADIFCIENLGARELRGSSKPEGITQSGLVGVNDNIVALS